jgi:DNA-binding HxlR family transcriptional regulator
MLRYGQFCPVAKTAEILADRWTPLIVRELCFGPCTFGDLLFAMPLISRTMLAQRLREMADAEVGISDSRNSRRSRNSGCCRSASNRSRKAAVICTG